MVIVMLLFEAMKVNLINLNKTSGKLTAIRHLDLSGLLSGHKLSPLQVFFLLRH